MYPASRSAPPGRAVHAEITGAGARGNHPSRLTRGPGVRDPGSRTDHSTWRQGGPDEPNGSPSLGRSRFCRSPLPPQAGARWRGSADRFSAEPLPLPRQNVRPWNWASQWTLYRPGTPEVRMAELTAKEGAAHTGPEPKESSERSSGQRPSCDRVAPDFASQLCSRWHIELPEHFPEVAVDRGWTYKQLGGHSSVRLVEATCLRAACHWACDAHDSVLPLSVAGPG